VLKTELLYSSLLWISMQRHLCLTMLMLQSLRTAVCRASSLASIVGSVPSRDQSLTAMQSGVNADSLSAEEYLNSKGETVVRKLDKAGEYGIYCEPHSGAGMKATITVS
jgi:Copper binding proteins, plastocyanin/azurin family